MPPSANEQGTCERLAGRVCWESVSRCQCHLAQKGRYGFLAEDTCSRFLQGTGLAVTSFTDFEDGSRFQCHLAQMSKELVRGWRGGHEGRHSVGGNTT
jgi:hypothetical protein